MKEQSKFGGDKMNEKRKDKYVDQHGNHKQENPNDVAKSMLKNASLLCASVFGGFGALVHFEKPELTTKDKILGCVFASIAVVALGAAINGIRKHFKHTKGQKGHKSVNLKKQEPSKQNKFLESISEFIAAVEIESAINDVIKKKEHKNAHKNDEKEM